MGRLRPTAMRPTVPGVLSRLARILWISLVGGWASTARPQAVISEFLADNATGLRDEDGDTSDWIEISNTSVAPLNLAGWRLTDRANAPGQWRFPEGVVLNGGGRLLVFASGKNRAISGRPLHANFSLSASGEYLALLPPSGNEPATAFAPSYPPQRTDVSFGIGLQEEVTLRVDDSHPSRLHLPVPARDDLTWTGSQEPFDDSSWLPATAAVGYDDLSEDFGETLLGYWTFDDISQGRTAFDSSGRKAHGSLIGPAGFSASGGGRSGKPGDRALDLGSGGTGASVRVDAAAQGAFDLLQARDRVTISLWTFGSPKLPMNHSVFWFGSGATNGNSRGIQVHLPWSDNVIYFDTSGCCAGDTRISRQELDPSHWRGRWNHYVFLKDGPRKEIWQNGNLWHSGTGAIPLPGIHSLWLGSEANGSSSYPGKLDEVAVWAGALSASDIRALAAGSRATAICSYRPWIRTDLTAQMHNQTSQAWLRIPFTIPDTFQPDWLQLSLRYDDGIRAWMDGQEIARDNVPVLRSRSKVVGFQPVTWQWSSAHLPLRSGHHWLAIEGLNDRPSGSDFLIQAELRMGRQRSQRFFTLPTPGEPNGFGIAGFTEAPAFSRGRGFYREPISVRLVSATPGSRLRYTLDGSTPTSNDGTLVEPDPVSGLAAVDIPISRSGPIRAMAFAADREPSPVQTQTYLFADQVERQPALPAGYPATWGVYGAYGPTPGLPVPADYEMDPDVSRSTFPGYGVTEAILSLPSVCITTEVAHLFDATTGIYPNSASQGSQWVRPASVEWIEPSTSNAVSRAGFQIDAGLRVHGGLSRQHWHARKHSFRVNFSREYGPSRLRFPLFDDTRVTSSDELTLRASSTDGWAVEDATPWTRKKATYLRDVWMKDTQQVLGWPCGHSRYVHLFLNGLYWGQYNLAERTEAAWLSENFGGNPEDYDIIKDFGELESGNRTAWDAMIATAASGLSSDAAYWKLQGRRNDGTRDPAMPVHLEVDSLIDYMILHIYSGAIDWPNHNWWSARCRDGTRGGFRFFTWDQEISNLSLTETKTYTGETFESVSGPRDSPAFLYSKLRDNARFRARFAARVTELTQGVGLLTPSQNAARWERRQAEIDRSIVAESARWGDSRQSTPLKRSDWIAEMAWMKNSYWPRIHGIAMARFRKVGLSVPIPAPAVTMNPAGGVVPVGTQITFGGGPDLFYTTDGTAPLSPDGEPTASARPDTAAVHVEGPMHIRAQRRLGTNASPVTEALFLTPDSVAAETDLEVCEIHYHPSAVDAEAFVEIRHRGAEGWGLLGGTRLSGDIDAVVPNGVVLGPGTRAVFVADLAAFRARYGQQPRVLGTYTGRLDQGGGTLRLLGPSGRVVARCTYDDTAPWPVEADGRGPSLTLRASSEGRDPNDPSQWRPSAVNGGTPGSGEALTFRGVPELDADGDGWSAIEEYFQGSQDSDPNDQPARRPEFRWGADGSVSLSLSHPLVADQAEVFWEQSDDLRRWKPIPGTSGSVQGVFGDGIETLRWTVPGNTDAQRYFRLRLQLR